MSTLNKILKHFDIKYDDTTVMPIEIHNIGRDTFAPLLSELGFKVGVELGVASGKYLEVLCKSNPDMKFFGVDPWMPLNGYFDYVFKKTFKTLYDGAVETMKPYTNYEFIQKISMDAINDFEDESIDFVYIDANHEYNFVMEDIIGWTKKVKKGGIICGHDYKRGSSHRHMRVVEAVNDYIKTTGLRPWFLIGGGAKDTEEIRDASRSWFWVKD